ncbi:MAG: crotonase/enoyl-CoA hydratase family protein, partial [Shewanella sp.]
LSLGLVTQLSDNPLLAAQQLASELGHTSPDALAAIKLSINSSWSARLRSLLSRESLSQIKLLLGYNRKIAAVRQLKDPNAAYKDRQAGW